MEGTRVCATDFTMPNLSTVKTSSISMALPWEWIVEKLVDMKEIGMPLFKAMIMNVADFNNPSCKSLQERVALRYVEEILLLDKIEAHAIPPVKLLISSSLPSSNAVHDLLLRVCTEVVLGHIREPSENGDRDWEGFEDALKRIFPEEDSSIAFITRRTELSRLLEDKSIYLSTLEKYPVETLKLDLRHFVREKKAYLNKTVLDQLDDDISEGRYYPSGSSWHCMHASSIEGSINGGSRKRLYREVDLTCKNTSSESEKRSKQDGRESCPSEIENSRECLTAKTYNGSGKKIQNSSSLGNSIQKLSKDARVTVENDHPDMECKLEIHHDGETGIMQISSGTESTSDSQLHHSESTDRCLHDLGEGMMKPEEDKHSDPTGRTEDHLFDAEELPELDFLVIREDCHEEICYKCKKGGALFCCNGCSIAVHGSCLGSDGPIIPGNDFYCPICSYKRALVAYKKAKKEAVESKKRLCAFIDINLVQDHGQNAGGCSNKCEKGDTDNIKEPSNSTCPFDLGSKKKQLHQQRKRSGIPISKAVTPCGIGNVHSCRPTEAADNRHDGDPGKDNTGVGKYHLRRRKPQMRGQPKSCGLRRNNLPWTKAEEQCLKVYY
eukprot:Gb_37050 [translate_table: standard]